MRAPHCTLGCTETCNRGEIEEFIIAALEKKKKKKKRLFIKVELPVAL